jgi:hypothetical protein
MTVNETPKFLAQDLTEHMHALTVQDPDNPVQAVIQTQVECYGVVLSNP